MREREIERERKREQESEQERASESERVSASGIGSASGIASASENQRNNPAAKKPPGEGAGRDHNKSKADRKSQKRIRGQQHKSGTQGHGKQNAHKGPTSPTWTPL